MIVVNIPVQNFQGVTVHLEAGTWLDTVKSVTVLPLNQCTTDVSAVMVPQLELWNARQSI